MKMKKIMIKKINNRRRSAQRIQDKIFMEMSAEKKNYYFLMNFSGLLKNYRI